jgi:hypothetical protein
MSLLCTVKIRHIIKNRDFEITNMLQCNIVMLPFISNLHTYHSNFPSVNGLIGTWSFLTLSLLNMSAD